MNEGTKADRVGVLVLAAGFSLAVGMALLTWQTTAIGSMLFMNHGIGHESAIRIERVLSLILAAAGAAVLVPAARCWAAGLLFVAALVLAWAMFDQGGYPFSRLVFGAQAMRIAAPLAVLLVFLPDNVIRRGRVTALKAVLIAAAATTFIVHGYEAILRHPWFVDMTIGWFDRVLGWRIRQSNAENLLLIVGIVDIAVAVALVAFRSRAAAGWMAFWGFFTCALRLVNYGSGALADAIVRLPHGLLPLALLVLLRSDHQSIRRIPLTRMRIFRDGKIRV